MVGVRGGVVHEQSPSGKAGFLQGHVGRPRARPRFWILLYLDSGFTGFGGWAWNFVTPNRPEKPGGQIPIMAVVVKARGDWDIRLEREPKAPIVVLAFVRVFPGPGFPGNHGSCIGQQQLRSSLCWSQHL